MDEFQMISDRLFEIVEERHEIGMVLAEIVGRVNQRDRARLAARDQSLRYELAMLRLSIPETEEP